MDHSLRGNWGNRDNKGFLYQIAFDFVAQLEDVMEAEGIDRAKLAQILGVTKGRVSQILNHPGNLTLKNIVQYASALKLKVTIVAYKDRDVVHSTGPIHPQVFVACWKKTGQPTDVSSANATVVTNTETLFIA
jgi:transcriptional regulator with XRE-family HTH domain